MAHRKGQFKVSRTSTQGGDLLPPHFGTVRARYTQLSIIKLMQPGHLQMEPSQESKPKPRIQRNELTAIHCTLQEVVREDRDFGQGARNTSQPKQWIPWSDELLQMPVGPAVSDELMGSATCKYLLLWIIYIGKRDIREVCEMAPEVGVGAWRTQTGTIVFTWCPTPIWPNLGKRSCRQAEGGRTVFIKHPWGRGLPAAELWCLMAKLENKRSWGEEHAF